MTTSETYNSGWVKRTSNGSNAPSNNDLRVSSSQKIKAQVVSASSGIVRAARYMRDHPVDFLISAATSMTISITVRWVLHLAFFPALGAGLATAMVASAIIGVGRTLNQEFKARRARVNALHSSAIAPTADDLAAARSINMAGVIETGMTRALFTGLLGGLTGAIVGHTATNALHKLADSASSHVAHASHNISSGPEYQKFLENLGESESGGDYTEINGKKFIGKYQFGEPAMVETGYYSYYDDNGNLIDKTNWQWGDKEAWTRKNTWEGRWTDKAHKFGINSQEDFRYNPDVQEQAVRELMARNWQEIVGKHLDSHIGETYTDHSGDSFKITEAGLLRGAHLGGVGGIQKFFNSNGTIDGFDGHKYVSDYMRDGAGFQVPFEEGNPNQIPFNLGYAMSEVRTVNGMDFIYPVSTDADYIKETSDFGNRFHPIKKKWLPHLGQDIGAFEGAPVLATAPGEVKIVNYSNSGIGNVIKIYHGRDNLGNEIYTRYGHLSEIDVKVGDKLPQGYKIGEVGSTGLSTAPHLHYEINVNGKTIDPQPYMPDGVKRGSRVMTRTR